MAKNENLLFVIDRGLCLLKQIELLQLGPMHSDEALTGTIESECIEKLINLKFLTIGGSAISNTQMYNTSAVTYTHLTGNITLQSFINAHNNNLTDISISNTNIKGHFFDIENNVNDYGLLANLTGLTLVNNQFYGTISDYSCNYFNGNRYN